MEHWWNDTDKAKPKHSQLRMTASLFSVNRNAAVSLKYPENIIIKLYILTAISQE
jgi:hypothetical protein